MEIETLPRMKDLRIKYKSSLEKTGNRETEASVLFNWNNTTTLTWTHVQNHVQNCVENHVQNHAQNHLRKIKDTANKNMSFLKITDPKNKDFIVNGFLKTRQNIQQHLFVRMCKWLEHTMRTFKALQPSYGHATNLKEGLVSELKPMREGMKTLSKSITFPQLPSITAYNDDVEEGEDVFIEDIAQQY